MKDKKIEIRISQDKKQLLKQSAQDMNVNVSTIMEGLIDNYLSNKEESSIIYNKGEISRCFMCLYNIIDNCITNETREELLSVLEELECLI